MTDLLSVLPTFTAVAFTNVLPSLERAQVSTADLLTLDAIDVAKRAQLPAREVRRLADAITQALQNDLGVSSGGSSLTEYDRGNTSSIASSVLRSTGLELVGRCHTISTLDEQLDNALRGGLQSGYLTEITGESGAGKTQFLLTLLLAVQLAPPNGLSRSALYITTEAPLQTKRLSQILTNHVRLATLPPESKPSLQRILSISTPDLESQEHILRYQVPVAIRRHNIGLVVIDSITANFRAEFDRDGQNGKAITSGAAMAKRTSQLLELGSLLRALARTENIAIVVANQVADRFGPAAPPQSILQNMPHMSAPSTQSSTSSHRDDADPLTLDHQQRWFTGWGDEESDNPNTFKTPSLGLVWTNQLACRITILKRPPRARLAPPSLLEGEGNHVERPSRRFMKIAFAPWAPAANGTHGVEFRIVNNGIVSVGKDDG